MKSIVDFIRDRGFIIMIVGTFIIIGSLIMTIMARKSCFEMHHAVALGITGIVFYIAGRVGVFLGKKHKPKDLFEEFPNVSNKRRDDDDD